MLFFAAGGEALLLAVAVVFAAVLARVALRTRGGSVALGALAVVFAMCAGVQLAEGLSTSGHWLAAVEALAAAMFCGSIVALKRFHRRAERASIDEPRHDDRAMDSTVEIEVKAKPRAAPIWSARSARALMAAGARSTRPRGCSDSRCC